LYAKETNTNLSKLLENYFLAIHQKALKKEK